MHLRHIAASELEKHPAYDRHEEVLRVEDPQVGLSAFIALHDTTLGPALGGCRVWRYASEAEALTDALRLSRGMTYKNALAGLNLGGGKAVIALQPGTAPSPALFRSFGAAIEELSGRYVTAEDVGTSPRDMASVAQSTAHVRGTPGSGVEDPSPFTALGVFHGILAAVEHRFGARDLEGLTASVQGLGHVGWRLAEKLARSGARLIVSDLDEARVERARAEWDAMVEHPARAHAARAEIFVPCALGAGLNRTTIPQISADIVAGAANNQLETREDAIRLTEKSILYAPDYAINAGGVIALALAGTRRASTGATEKVEAIGATLAAIFARASREGRTTAEIADQLAEERLTAARRRSQAA
ncbi:Glu/Leu/Phe/Val dehydrogenase [Afifella sp. IM 167]|uniref:Glu/Leu/Phe/Val family dehydrogenase n=1 Tax=Afifella sp. IM 167 TaxID=2033586 RepID=UPI001CCA4C3F|nr:Glu/Leu/Phe/Val dehydrogenase dimerization domain-containing protein [Afifella sp. IM 167]MBZ8132680.1 amino acid dehydrogenase [Afifella sp. IM 167]